MTNTTQLQQQAEKTIQRTMTVPLSVERAYTLFTEELASWWPTEYTWAQDVLETIAIEPGENGRCFERGPHNFECDWGRVLIWEPPNRLMFTWQISPRREPEPNPAKASKVEVRFEVEASASTHVQFEHRGLDRHGEGAADYHSALDSPQGWPYILDCYLNAAERKANDKK